MRIDIDKLPEWAKLEIRKEDLLAFAEKLRLQSISTESTPTKEQPEELFNFEEMCDFLGIAKSTGYQRVSRGEIPHFKKGRRLYFRKTELVEWIETGRRKTRAELDEIAEKYLEQYKNFK